MNGIIKVENPKTLPDLSTYVIFVAAHITVPRT